MQARCREEIDCPFMIIMTLLMSLVGFAELQTDLDDWEQALSSDHLPMLPFRQYAMRILFPRDEDHAVLHPLSQKVSHSCNIIVTRLSNVLHFVIDLL